MPRLRTAIVTARNAPAHKRVVATLRNWGIEVDEVFFLGGISKNRVIEEFKPHFSSMISCSTSRVSLGRLRVRTSRLESLTSRVRTF